MGIQFSGLASGLDTQSIITDLMSVERMKVENVEKQKVLAEWKKEAWEEVNTKLYSFYKEELFDFKSVGTYNQKTLTSSNESLITTNTSSAAVRGVHTIDVTSMAKGSFLTGDELTTDINGDPITASTTAADLFGLGASDTSSLLFSTDGGATTNEITIESTDTISDIVTKIQDLDMDLNISFDETFNRLFVSSTETGEDVQLQVSTNDATDDVLTSLGFGAANRTGTDGDDAVYTYNGTQLTSSSNEVSVNGLSFNILGENDSATITVSQDTEAIYDTVKSFLNKYNELMTEINEKLDADSAREYEPLTDQEKESMSEDDIELWESKIKESLLRRDNTLFSITLAMRNTLTVNSGVDTSSFTYSSISELGIVTGGYEEKGLLHIEGDEDDSLYSVKENKLRNAIENDPDEVMELLSALGDSLYEDFNTRMKSSSISSALTFYNDKYLDDQITDYEDSIFDLEDKMVVIEERYYKQFTAMEQAIQQANSTGDWLAQQLGGM